MKTKRWNDPAAEGDGTRILVSRYRPRGVRKEDETWHEWLPNLGPSRELHAAFYGKHVTPITWEEYAPRYLTEMRAQKAAIAELARRLIDGETITLLCSSACTDPARCHRTALRDLIEQPTPRRAHPRRHAAENRLNRAVSPSRLRKKSVVGIDRRR